VVKKPAQSQKNPPTVGPRGRGGCRAKPRGRGRSRRRFFSVFVWRQPLRPPGNLLLRGLGRDAFSDFSPELFSQTVFFPGGPVSRFSFQGKLVGMLVARWNLARRYTRQVFFFSRPLLGRGPRWGEKNKSPAAALRQFARPPPGFARKRFRIQRAGFQGFAKKNNFPAVLRKHHPSDPRNGHLLVDPSGPHHQSTE